MASNKLLFSHPTGNANVRAALTGLLGAGLLGEFHTSVAAFPGNVWDRLSRTRLGREFQRRRFDPRLQAVTVQHPVLELGRLLATRLGGARLIRHETGPFCTDAVYQAQDRAVSCELRAASRSRIETPRFTGVYAYEDGALASFLAARDLQLRCYYDLPIAYWETAQRLLREEAQRWPAWEPTLGGTRDSAAKLARKRQELELANVVLCPSQFAADSIPDWARPGKKIVVAPFGSPSVNQELLAESIEQRARRLNEGRPLRILFAGSLTQRKGLADLFAAMAQLKRQDVELVVMGSPQVPLEFYRREFPDFIFEPPRPHAQVLELMRTCDVFCLPSLVEGRALVMQEAMSQGLPLIITPHTGGEDLIVAGETGFLVPIRQPEAIAEKIAWFADHQTVLPEMSLSAQRKAAAYTWEAYGQKVAEAVMGASDL